MNVRIHTDSDVAQATLRERLVRYLCFLKAASQHATTQTLGPTTADAPDRADTGQLQSTRWSELTTRSATEAARDLVSPEANQKIDLIINHAASNEGVNTEGYHARFRRLFAAGDEIHARSKEQWLNRAIAHLQEVLAKAGHEHAKGTLMENALPAEPTFQITLSEGIDDRYFRLFIEEAITPREEEYTLDTLLTFCTPENIVKYGFGATLLPALYAFSIFKAKLDTHFSVDSTRRQLQIHVTLLQALTDERRASFTTALAITPRTRDDAPSSPPLGPGAFFGGVSSAQSSSTPEPSEQNEAFASPPRRHIMVIEDEKLVRTLMLRHLNPYCAAIDLAASGKAAVNHLLDLPLDHWPELILCDFIMPDKNGVETLAELLGILTNKFRQIQEAPFECRIAILSATPSSAISTLQEYPYCENPLLQSVKVLNKADYNAVADRPRLLLDENSTLITRDMFEPAIRTPAGSP